MADHTTTDEYVAEDIDSSAIEEEEERQRDPRALLLGNMKRVMSSNQSLDVSRVRALPFGAGYEYYVRAKNAPEITWRVSDSTSFAQAMADLVEYFR